jgi:hypothetical protein
MGGNEIDHIALLHGRGWVDEPPSRLNRQISSAGIGTRLYNLSTSTGSGRVRNCPCLTGLCIFNFAVLYMKQSYQELTENEFLKLQTEP